MSKTIKVKFTYEVRRSVTIPPPPKDCEDIEEFENLQIEAVCDEGSFGLDGNVSASFQRLE